MIESLKGWAAFACLMGAALLAPAAQAQPTDGVTILLPAEIETRPAAAPAPALCNLAGLMAAIELADVHKSFGPIHAVNGLDLDVPPGICVRDRRSPAGSDRGSRGRSRRACS